ncbi:hypothetical protein BDA96_01G030900 [Sorghum bicolor]|uniref:ELM2 domain-containing protein n=2 Tax=Sorghum bicolor TaxID=4558 RepID=A0A921RWS0_SORBI|nr:uncharacterized protein LOC8080219 [Sorghum bicolor]KAG0546870.1 hypothetical protein BDA96_01G030900 [Sorghum bicolor]KXG37230.1 hypothetical protein SORBI_3001G029700 [Sorghum bicolor]|eukprot:XP_021319635.1 uncharacterized protein LOC8080219 [Sorghum bicolor]
MVGSDVPPGGSGAPPGSPERPRKRKSGAEVAAAAEDASPRRTTRSSASSSAQVDVKGAVAWARRVAAGELWAVRGRNRGIDVDLEPLGAVILAVRHVRSKLDPDDPDTPYYKKQRRHHKQDTRSSGRRAGELGHLSSFLESTRKRIGIDPVTCQAAIPEYNDPSEESNANYRNDKDTLQRMGTVVRLPPIVEPPRTRKCSHPVSEDDNCKCSHPGSEACVEVHVREAWKRVKYQLGDQAFRNCGFDAMGERVLKLWTAEEKKKLADIEKLIPQSKSSDEDFMKVALEQFSSERTTDLAKYYYNVFLPRRLASLNRTEATNSIDASPDNEGNNQDDDNKVHRSEEKSKGSGSSSKRSLG